MAFSNSFARKLILQLHRCLHVACGVSGGVDSAVSAYLLKQKGFKVTCVFMQNWDPRNEVGQCTVEADYTDAQYVCEKLHLPLVQVNFVKEYWNNVFIDFIKNYEEGRTPNPDVLCNKYIKFGCFFDHAIKHMKMDVVATGHYAQNSAGNFLEDQINTKGGVKLLMSKDRWKDQTLFLSQIQQDALQKTMFPIGDLLKKEVKAISKQIGLEKIAKKKESTGICFIGKRNFHEFIEEYIEPKSGRFIDIESGKEVGQHRGTHYWTIGQRALIKGRSHAYYVVRVNAQTQEVLVANRTHHPALYSQELYTESPHWIHKPPDGWNTLKQVICQFKFQHVHKLQACTIEHMPNNLVRICTELPIRALTPGQFSVFYQGEECLGSARIVKVGQSLFELGLSSVCDLVDMEYEVQQM